MCYLNQTRNRDHSLKSPTINQRLNEVNFRVAGTFFYRAPGPISVRVDGMGDEMAQKLSLFVN